MVAARKQNTRKRRVKRILSQESLIFVQLSTTRSLRSLILMVMLFLGQVPEL